MKKAIKTLFKALVAIIFAVVIFFGAVWLIDGRSFKAFIISRSLTRSTLEDYEKAKG